MKKLFLFAAALLTVACTPRVETYCSSYGVPKGHREFGACQTYFTKMENWFAGDYTTCHSKAANAFPDYMYDHPRYGEINTIDRYGLIRSNTVLIEPDHYRNQSLDLERRKIIAPCMAQLGWNSPDSWQAGRVDSPNTAPHF